MRKDKIITSFVYPPIPVRSHDWCAYRENDVENADKYGWGPTEEDAIAMLHSMEEMECEEEREEQKCGLCGQPLSQCYLACTATYNGDE